MTSLKRPSENQYEENEDKYKYLIVKKNKKHEKANFLKENLFLSGKILS